MSKLDPISSAEAACDVRGSVMRDIVPELRLVCDPYGKPIVGCRRRARPTCRGRQVGSAGRRRYSVCVRAIWRGVARATEAAEQHPLSVQTAFENGADTRELGGNLVAVPLDLRCLPVRRRAQLVRFCLGAAQECVSFLPGALERVPCRVLGIGEHLLGVGARARKALVIFRIGRCALLLGFRTGSVALSGGGLPRCVENTLCFRGRGDPSLLGFRRNLADLALCFL